MRIDKEKLILYLERLFSINFFIFLSLAFYSKTLVKVCFCFGFLLYLSFTILKYKKYFYKYLIPSTPLNKPILLFLISAFLSTVFSLNSSHSQEIFFQRYIPYFIFFFMGFTLNKKSLKSLYICLIAFLFSSIIFSIGAIRDYLLFHPNRLFTVFGKSFIFISEFLLFILPLSYALFIFSQDKILKILSFINLALSIPVLVWHGSRGVWVTILFTLFIVSLFNFKRFFLWFVSIGVIASILIFINPNFKERAETLFRPLSRATLDDRIDLAKTSWDIFRTYPLFGAGLGMFEYLYKPVRYEPSYIHYHAHSTFLEVLSEMGIFGFMFLGIIVFSFYRVGLRNLKLLSGEVFPYFAGISGVIFAYTFSSLFGSRLLVGVSAPSLFWAFGGMFLALGEFVRKTTV
ncbi:MAG: hypothetical protein DRP81_05470 [Candidatus Omnitrophota bacterium]|nr:MAG: hypothetical protein DRP81_05470 [Candidatus Omnitrophota bacterium]